jgi:hypothetical protein
LATSLEQFLDERLVLRIDQGTPKLSGDHLVVSASIWAQMDRIDLTLSSGSELVEVMCRSRHYEKFDDPQNLARIAHWKSISVNCGINGEFVAFGTLEVRF